MAPVIFVFLDGVGLAPAGHHRNPFGIAPMPALRQLLGTPLVAGVEISCPGLLFTALDALLGVDGIPQSATGQTALFTGVNAAKVLGYHLPAYPNAALINLLHTQSILRRAAEMGFRVTSANAYSELYLESVRRHPRRMSATTHSILGAGLPLRWVSDLESGKAVYWDITGEQLRQRLNAEVPVITPEQAGANLARLSQGYDLVLFESFWPDLIGHRKEMDRALNFLDLLDRFLDALWKSTAPEVTVLLCSDHGNFEDLGRGIHTLNPVPLLVRGPGAAAFRFARSLTDVAGPILAVLSDLPYTQSTT